ncbi:MAG: hypothetical protein JZU47_01105 [Prolixibacteraceae bacterium]|nr:hypothetical protein [Prolixibacteraceae bacterium]
MKTLTYFLAFTVLCSFCAVKAKSQTIAVGHISAEVVESVSATSFTSTEFVINNTELTADNNGTISAENIIMGTIRINSGQNVACNVTFKPALLLDRNGNDFILEPLARNSEGIDIQRVDGIKNIELIGRATLDSSQAKGVYQGSYTLVFAYN